MLVKVSYYLNESFVYVARIETHADEVFKNGNMFVQLVSGKVRVIDPEEHETGDKAVLYLREYSLGDLEESLDEVFKELGRVYDLRVSMIDGLPAPAKYDLKVNSLERIRE